MWNLAWLKDYGAFIAATAAVIVTILNGFLQARRDRAGRTSEWLRQERIPRYVAFVRAANDFTSAIFWEFGNPDPTIVGPMPREVRDYQSFLEGFRQQLAEVTLVGPAEVATAARIVQYACWHYEGQLERNPDDFDQSLITACISDFLVTAQEALGVKEAVAVTPEYRTWRESLPEKYQ